MREWVVGEGSCRFVDKIFAIVVGVGKFHMPAIDLAGHLRKEDESPILVRFIICRIL